MTPWRGKVPSEPGRIAFCGSRCVTGYFKARNRSLIPLQSLKQPSSITLIQHTQTPSSPCLTFTKPQTTKHHPKPTLVLDSFLSMPHLSNDLNTPPSP
ncbi:hypothetical protein E2C01_013197 [Portunus trituberculatus]|uniref:Uncharacterized protein n=1 Tax=Portunus trituberculatus TaxID=210409 RepID=A0A5B7DFM2_PORTR|nr:hypothetical protein [Portunus trituberculatus]